jgi:putrescine transport system permease protein
VNNSRKKPNYFQSIFNGRNAVIAIPYIWLLLLFLLPFIFVLKISLAEPIMAIPPYTSLLKWSDSWLPSIAASLDSYLFLFSDSLYIKAYLSSLKIAIISTILTLIIGYSIAYSVARAPTRWRGILLMLVILPFWTSFLIRVYAWIGILKTE